MPDPDTTPSEDLLLEVLAARHRLGHQSWPFDKQHRKTLDSLVKKNLIYIDFGPTEGSFDVELTSKGRSRVLDSDYQPPIYQYVKEEFRDYFIINE